MNWLLIRIYTVDSTGNPGFTGFQESKKLQVTTWLQRGILRLSKYLGTFLLVSSWKLLAHCAVIQSFKHNDSKSFLKLHRHFVPSKTCSNRVN